VRIQMKSDTLKGKTKVKETKYGILERTGIFRVFILMSFLSIIKQVFA
jgi:hypothetical protein